MAPELALKLVAILEAYFTRAEVIELAALFGVTFDDLDSYGADEQRSWLPFSRELIGKLEYGNSRRLLDNLLDLADVRNTEGIAHTSYERRSFHENMAGVLSEAHRILDAYGGPSEDA